MPRDLDTLTREQLSRVLRGRPDPETLEPHEDLVETYGLTSLNKVLFLTSLCKAADVGIHNFTDEDLARMRTLGDVVDALRPHAAEGAVW